MSMNKVSNAATTKSEPDMASCHQSTVSISEESPWYTLLNCDTWVKPFVQQKLASSSTVVAFNLALMLHRNGIWNTAEPEKIRIFTHLITAFRKEVLEPGGYTLDTEVWPLVKALEVDREQADRAASTQLTGFCFCWNKRSACDEIFAGLLPQRLLCMQPALPLGVMARIKDGFYQSNRTPDYTVGHLIEQFAFINDTQLSGHPLYPMWSGKRN